MCTKEKSTKNREKRRRNSTSETFKSDARNTLELKIFLEIKLCISKTAAKKTIFAVLDTFSSDWYLLNKFLNCKQKTLATAMHTYAMKMKIKGKKEQK